MGWQNTPDGLLSPKEIQAAGFVFQDGEYKIPAQVYIAESSAFGRPKGQKYIGASEQYMQWRKYYKKKRYGYKGADDYINEEIKEGSPLDNISF